MTAGGRTTALTAGIGVVAVVAGLLVLRSPAAQVELGWFAYGAPAPPALDGIVAWNLARAVGAVLVLLSLLVLAHLLGLLAARRSAVAGPRLAGRVLVLSVLLVVGGLVTFVVLRAAGPRTQGFTYSSSAWSPDQTAAALVVATGLVVGAVGTGLRRRDAA